MSFDLDHEGVNINELASDWVRGERFLGQDFIEPMVVLD